MLVFIQLEIDSIAVKIGGEMAQQIMVECPTDPDDQDATNEFILNAFSKCKITKAKMAKELQDIGKATSERDAARQLAEIEGRSEGATRLDIQRGRKELAQVVPPTQTPEMTQEDENATMDEKDATNEKDDKVETVIMCKQCNERVAKKRMKNGKVYYYPQYLCGRCRVAAGGAPTGNGKKKTEQEKQQKKQANHWKVATKKLKSLAEYMLENCQTPNGLPENIKEEFLQYFDTMEVFENELR